jgi:hypothetical protein
MHVENTRKNKNKEKMNACTYYIRKCVEKACKNQ